MNLKVYCRTNIKTQKKYIGVTSKSLDERWNLSVTHSAKVVELFDRVNNPAKIGDHKYRDKYLKQLKRLENTLIYDIATHSPDDWLHEIMFESDNLVDALITEMNLIQSMNTIAPHGYNRSKGGELPKWVLITTVIDQLKNSKLVHL